MRLLRTDEVLDVVPALYERVARRWVGTIGRPDMDVEAISEGGDRAGVDAVRQG